MDFYFAPMEGITGYLFRNEFHRQFDCGIEKYFTPFLAITHEGISKSKEKKDIAPENNQGMQVIPQLLGNRGEYAIPYFEKLQEMGYTEINLNVGCPYGTVVSKKKGAGLLLDRELLQTYLDTIFDWKIKTNSPCRISVKTRSGMNSHEELSGILEIYNDYPLSEVILHPRVGTDLYKNTPCLEDMREAMKICKHSLCYNGDIFTKEDYQNLLQKIPGVNCLMLGRGLLVNPSLLREIMGGERISKEEFLTYESNITFNYVNQQWGDKTVLFKMKELWNYWQYLFAESDKYLKKIRKSQRVVDYENAVHELVNSCEIDTSRGFGG